MQKAYHEIEKGAFRPRAFPSGEGGRFRFLAAKRSARMKGGMNGTHVAQFGADVSGCHVRKCMRDYYYEFQSNGDRLDGDLQS